MSASPATQSRPKRHARQRQTAVYLCVSESFLEKARVAGNGPPFAKIGKAVIYDLDDADEWVKERKRRSTSETTAE